MGVQRLRGAEEVKPSKMEIKGKPQKADDRDRIWRWKTSIGDLQWFVCYKLCCTNFASSFVLQPSNSDGLLVAAINFGCFSDC